MLIHALHLWNKRTHTYITYFRNNHVPLDVPATKSKWSSKSGNSATSRSRTIQLIMPRSPPPSNEIISTRIQYHQVKEENNYNETWNMKHETNRVCTHVHCACTSVCMWVILLCIHLLNRLRSRGLTTPCLSRRVFSVSKMSRTLFIREIALASAPSSTFSLPILVYTCQSKNKPYAHSFKSTHRQHVSATLTYSTRPYHPNAGL